MSFGPHKNFMRWEDEICFFPRKYHNFQSQRDVRAALEATTTANRGCDLSKHKAIRRRVNQPWFLGTFNTTQIEKWCETCELARRDLPGIPSGAADLRGFLRWEKRDLENLCLAFYWLVNMKHLQCSINSWREGLRVRVRAALWNCICQ